MNHKQIKYIAVIGIFILSFISHYIYNIIPSPFLSPFFPVNESIWEHMKIIFTPIIIYGIIDYYLLTKYNIKHQNFISSLSISSISSVIIYLLIYLPLYELIGENLFISISLLFIVIIISQLISYYIQKRNNIKLDIISCLLIIISYIIFGYLTYYPFKNYIFFDTSNNMYGINTYYLGN